MTLFSIIGTGLFVYAIGMVSLLIQRDNLINILIAFEVMMLGLNLSFIGIGIYLNDLFALVTVFLTLVIAAAESVLILAIMVCFYRLVGSSSTGVLRNLKG